MGTELHNLRPATGSRRKRKRIGRGESSGQGKTSGRGHKGQRSRSGAPRRKPGFEGGQMPLQRRLPKRGFTNIFKKDIQVINVGDLARLEGLEVTPDALLEAGLIQKVGDGVKLLANGDVDRALTVRLHAFSAAAAAKITGAGGTTEVIPPRTRGRAKA